MVFISQDGLKAVDADLVDFFVILQATTGGGVALWL